MLVDLICPQCRAELQKVEGGFRCAPCEQTYGSSHGVVNFLGGDEEYNEGGYQAYQKAKWSGHASLRDRIRKSWLLSLLMRFRIRFSMAGRRDRIFADYMKRGDRESVIMDLGCGGGRHYFCDYGRVVGADPEMELLYAADEIYDEVYRCLGGALPFADESFDYVVSTDVIGHIKPEDKDALFAEMYRVLKKGGRAIHVIETDATTKWFKFAHQYPDLFQKYFVDRPGHYGLELCSQVKARFEKHGFKQIVFKKVGSSIPEIGFYQWFNNEYRQKCKALNRRVAFERLLMKNFLIWELSNILLEPIGALNDRMTPLDYGCGGLVVFEK